MKFIIICEFMKEGRCFQIRSGIYRNAGVNLSGDKAWKFGYHWSVQFPELSGRGEIHTRGH